MGELAASALEGVGVGSVIGYRLAAHQKVRGIPQHLAAEVRDAGLAFLRVQDSHRRRCQKRPVQDGKRADVPQMLQQNRCDAEVVEADNGLPAGFPAGIIPAVPHIAV